uniref:F-box and WD repeat domain containing 9 n=1 Tax=Xiphophorus couchianus TaxID=32473 RepID=A0A3B5MM48_9TELE
YRDEDDLSPPVSSPSAGPSPSPSASAESSDLLLLPWEILTHIASYLPAHCLINVLPKVCRTLSTVGEDATAWQLRAQRLIGSRVRFPVGPRDDFDWPTSCLEMEQLITFWRGQVAEGHENEGGEGVARVGVAAQEVAYGADEGIEVVMEVENDEIQPVLDGDQVEQLREGLEGRLEVDAAALIEDGRMEVEMVQDQPSRSPSPPPALECITLPSSHIALVNSVLLLGGKGAVCATGSRDYDVKLWDLEEGSNGALLHTLGRKGDFTSHQGWVWCLASEGPLLASGSFDSTVRLWDLQAGGTNRGLIRTGSAVLCLSCQNDVLLAGTFNKRINMYDTRAAEPLIKSVHLHGNAVMCLAADDTYIVSGSEDCTVAVYDCRAMKALKKIKLSSYLSSMSYSGYEVWAGDKKGMLHSFSMQTSTLKLLSRFDVGHTALVTGIHKSAGCLYTCSTDKTVKIHIPSGPPRTLCTLCHAGVVHGLSVEAGIVAVSTGDETVNIWRPRK